MPDTFKIAVRKFAPFEKAMQDFWNRFCQQTGCSLQLEMDVMDLHDLHEKTLQNAGLVNGDYDMAHINTDWVLEGYKKGAFYELSALLENDPPDHYPHGWSSSLLELQNFNGNVVGLPFHDGPECFIYRKDLFEDEQEKTLFKNQYNRELSVPKTWSEFVEVAQFFHRPEQNLHGSVFACYPDGHNTVFDFCLQLWTRGGELLNANGAMDLDTPQAVKALDFYRQLVNNPKALHPKSREVESVGAGQLFANGEVAMMINWFGFASVCEVDENSAVKGKVNVALLPSEAGFASASLNVYWLYTIAQGSKNKAVAYQFLKFVTTAHSDKQLTLTGGIGCRLSTWHDAEVNQLVPYYHQLAHLHQVAKTLPQKPNWAQMAMVIDEMVLKAINTQEPTLELLKQAQQKLNALENELTNTL